jgi:hypothetical protein
MEMFTSEPSSILAQLPFVSEIYPTKFLVIHASSAVLPDTLIDPLLYFNALYSQCTSRTPIIVFSTDSFSHRMFELSFIFKLIM